MVLPSPTADFLVVQVSEYPLCQHDNLTYRFTKYSNTLRSWLEPISSSMKTSFREAPCQVQSNQDELRLGRENVKRLRQLYPSDTAKQIDESGLSRSTFYHRRKEVTGGL